MNIGEKLNKARGTQNIMSAVSLILVGIIAIAFGMLNIKFARESAGVDYAETQAVITAIEETWVNDTHGSSYEYTTLVSYTVNGTEYRDVELGYYTADMQEGDTVTVKYDPADPSSLKSQSPGVIGYIMFAVGIGLAVFGVVSMVKARKASQEPGEYDRVDLTKVSQEAIQAVADSTEAKTRYLFHFDQKFKQGYVMKNEQGQLVYEIKMQKLTLFTPFDYDFVNHLTLRTVSRKIGHTISFSSGTTLIPGFSTEIPLSKYFTVDGQKNWDYLAENGFSFEVTREGLSYCYDVKKYGVPVAFIKTVGTNAMTGKERAVGKLPVNGIYQVDCRNSDLDMIAMVCMSIARAIFFES